MSFAVAREKGVLINSVDVGAPAHKAGLLQGDIIISYDGQTVLDSKSLQKLVAESYAGKSVRLKIIREGIEKTVYVEVGKYMS